MRKLTGAFWGVGLAGLLASAALAAPSAYVMETDQSTVAFETDMAEGRISGDFPVSSANLTLDFDHLEKSKIAVVLDASHARANAVFAADAMKSATVLDTAKHPEISFASTSVKKKGEGATVAGNLTIRGVTRPVTLNAQLYRQKGHAADDLSHLTVRLTGAVQRSDFGANGWSDMVGDQVRLDIRALIVRVD